MKIACIVLASGNSTRFKNSKSKLLYKVYGVPIIEYTLKNITKFFSKDSLYITISKKLTKKEKDLLSKYTNHNLINGGRNRFESLRNAINNIKNCSYDYLLIHDAARPLTPYLIFEKLFKNIKKNKYDCIVPKTKVEDTLRRNNITVKRSIYSTYQTPQVFKFNLIKKNLKNLKKIPTDDFGILERKKNLKIKYIDGVKENIKITTINDINIFKLLVNKKIKFGNGFDIHKLKKGKYLALGGLKIKSNFQAIGYSDGDVVIHSIIDALLGANNKGDIGTYFPSLKKYKNISSVILLDEIKKIIKLDNSIISNLDCTIICQKIRLEKYKKLIRKNISSLMKCDEKHINVKAKTADNIGILGKSKAVACWTTIKITNL